jgi:hypothetical protein
MSGLLGQEPSFASAAVTGYRRSVERIDGEDIPFMVPDENDPRNVLTGVVWLDLTQGSLERIESLELERGLRKRITVDARIGELRLDLLTYIRR